MQSASDCHGDWGDGVSRRNSCLDLIRHLGGHACSESGVVGGLPGLLAGGGEGNPLHNRTKLATNRHRRNHTSANLARTAVTGGDNTDIGGAVGTDDFIGVVITG